MSATFASSSWSASQLPVAGRSPWRWGEAVEVDGDPVLQWVLRRNCSLTPRQLLIAYLSVCVISLGVAAGFMWLGAGMVLGFAGLELLVFGIALLVHARHATDRETITLQGDALSVETRCGSSVERMDFRSAWVRVEPVHGEGSLLELSGQGRRVRVGRYVRPELRGSLAQELRRALRTEGRPQGGENDLGMELK